MTSRRSLVFAVGVAALALAAPTLAVTGGDLDGTAHPAVGLVLADRGNGLEPDCSGTLIAPAALLTAAHCADGLVSPAVAITFAPQYVPGASTLVLGVIHPDPLWGRLKNDSHDLAVVTFAAPVPGIRPLGLPVAGLLDSLEPKSQQFTNVGYGFSARVTGGGPPRFAFDGFRRFSTSDFRTLKATEIDLADKPGGVCFGDSGGPRLVGSTIVAVTSTGNKSCSGQSTSYRLDTLPARAFLAGFVSLP